MKVMIKKLKFILFLTILMQISSGLYAQMKIEIKEGIIKVNGIMLTSPWTFENMTNSKVFGKEDRSDLGGANDIFTYDNKGIIFYKVPKTNKVSDFNLYFGKDPDQMYNFIPTGLYPGVLNIEGFSISATTSLASLQSALKKYNFVKTSIEAYYGEFNNIYLYIQFDPQEKNIYWVSIGMND